MAWDVALSVDYNETQKMKRKPHHYFGMGLTKESVTGPYPEMHGLGLILAQCQIGAGQKHVRKQIQAER